MSGVLLNCAYLGIFKTNKVMVAAGLSDFSGTILIVFGLLSIVAAATYILKQTEYKRMLAYSSIENMGIIALGTGIGGLGVYGAVICMIHHSLIKSSLFLSSGNILMGYEDRLIANTGQMAKKMPKTFVAFFCRVCRYFRVSPFWYFHRGAVHHHGSFQDRPLSGSRYFYLQPVRDLCRICQADHGYLL